MVHSGRSSCASALASILVLTGPLFTTWWKSSRSHLQNGHSAFVLSPRESKLARVVRHDGNGLESTPVLETHGTDEDPEARRQRLNMLCVTFLQQVGNVEQIIEAGECERTPDGNIDFDGFRGLLDKIEMGISREEAWMLFKEMDNDSDGSIAPSEMRQTIRNSGAINQMYSEGLKNIGITVVPALITAGLFAYFQGPSSGVDFLTGYVVEDSLSVDNIFVFLTLFKYFKVPPSLQVYCLNLGIIGAVVLRAFFIFAGLAAVKAFEPLLLVFSAILLYSSYTVLVSSEDDEENDDEEPPEVIQGILSQLPTTNKFFGDKLTVESPDGKTLVTPLALCIIAIELSDILFAVDSVPAVFAVTEDPLIVYTSNIAAILGLRSIYQVLAIAVTDLVYLEKAVAVILGFVGFKLGAGVAGIEISSTLSLAFIILVLAIGVISSLLMRASSQESEDEEFKRRKKSTLEKVIFAFSNFWDK